MDINPQTMLQANLLGAIDGTLTEDNLARCDVVLVALYPAAIVTWITEHQDAFRPGAWVIDCGGVKEAVCTPLNALAQGKPWHYCGGHPMAGREFSGFRYAKDDLFDRASHDPYPTQGCGARGPDLAEGLFPHHRLSAGCSLPRPGSLTR